MVCVLGARVSDIVVPLELPVPESATLPEGGRVTGWVMMCVCMCMCVRMRVAMVCMCVCVHAAIVCVHVCVYGRVCFCLSELWKRQ
jgi:hypothetical protein